MLIGMKDMLAKGKLKVILELHPEQLSILGHSVSEINELFSQYNYTVYLIEKDGKLRELDRMSENHHAQYFLTREEI